MNFAQIPILGVSNAFHPFYKAVLDRAVSLGYTLPSYPQQIKQNRMVTEFVRLNIWTKYDLLYIFATDGDSNFSTINWKTPASYQCSPVNSPTFTTNQGWAGNGTSSYLNTTWDPFNNRVNWQQYDCSFGGYVNTVSSANTSAQFGANDATNTNSSYLQPWFSGGTVYRINSSLSNQNGSSPGSAKFLWHVTSPDASNSYLYRNGSLYHTGSVAGSAAHTASDFYIGARNDNGTAANYTTRQTSMFFTGASMSGLEDEIYTVWNTYFTSL